ncbi:hypothetical protein [Streptomyces sp. NPDC093568]|uniref:hypothetical protein n=1 Tax=Streptomyces sp. NPDC093568 TaxID=3366041 RepID=UPI003828E3F9
MVLFVSAATRQLYDRAGLGRREVVGPYSRWAVGVRAWHLDVAADERRQPIDRLGTALHEVDAAALLVRPETDLVPAQGGAVVTGKCALGCEAADPGPWFGQSCGEVADPHRHEQSDAVTAMIRMGVRHRHDHTGLLAFLNCPSETEYWFGQQRGASQDLVVLIEAHSHVGVVRLSDQSGQGIGVAV